MNGIIYAPSKDFEQLIRNNRFEFVHKGLFDSAETRNILLEAARINLLTLLIDLSAINGAGPGLLDSLLTFRIQRPHARIIVFAPGKRPGDPLMAGLFAKGIYDLVVPEEDEDISTLLSNVLSSDPATFADAARWAAQSISYPASRPDKTEKRIKETVYLEKEAAPTIIERPIGMATVVVSGAGPGCGTSHLSLALAQQLASAGNNVLLAEWPEGTDEVVSQYAYYLNIHGAKVDSDLYSCSGFHIYPGSKCLRSIDYVFQKAAHNYNYLVLDLGSLNSDNIREMDRASLPILVTPAAPFRYPSYIKSLREDDLWSRPLSTWTLALNLATEKYSYYFKNTLEQVFERIIDIPYFPDPLDDPPEEILLGLLSPVMRGIVSKNNKRGLRKALFWK